MRDLSPLCCPPKSQIPSIKQVSLKKKYMSIPGVKASPSRFPNVSSIIFVLSDFRLSSTNYLPPLRENEKNGREKGDDEE
ncbi:uncharacterized protein K444DRAFT_62228 [Hyaloscypha bicolor E]|uniref:Uncharacterized protein n=1 Tax=Hyaloscypha bicolor E TaxID=1095630 RepID=A0A2J6T0C7_9HELO|nr:uncharacterized protein K444DRAFT_62228 [Hyaloscypha bicolor E]PMD56383.1 hypothetical protein K444DRAFT_62228 [Hyaloscypha bicolor E]